MVLIRKNNTFAYYQIQKQSQAMTLFSKNKKTRTSITIDSLIHNTLKSLAEKDGRSLSNYIEIMAKTHIENVQKGKQTQIK